MPIEPLQQADSLKERAYNVIKGAILSLELQPREFISIGNLASQLAVSRTPVREALLLLEREGLVSLVPHKGAYISEINPRDVQESFEIRIVLERYAAKIATPRLSDSDLEALERILEESECAINREQYMEASKIGRQLHDILVEKVNNNQLIKYLSELDTHYTRFRHFSALVPGRLQKSHQQHLNILAALKDKDADRAEQMIANHITSVRDDILTSIDTWITEINGESGLMLEPNSDMD